VIVCSGTFGSVRFEDKAQAAAAAGFSAMSVVHREAGPGTRRVLDDLGLGVAEIDGAMAWLPGEPGPEPAAVIELAAELGARSVNVLVLGRELPDLGLAAAAFADLCERCDPLGLDVHFEPFAWSALSATADAAEIVRRAGHPRGGILLDTWHLVRGPEAGVVAPAAVPYVQALQISDPAAVAPVGSSLRDECMSTRRWPGPVARSIVDAFAGLPVEIEVFNAPGSTPEVARAAAEALRAFSAS
jgi:sugar phosphate isomerase/epimerase